MSNINLDMNRFPLPIQIVVSPFVDDPNGEKFALDLGLGVEDRLHRRTRKKVLIAITSFSLRIRTDLAPFTKGFDEGVMIAECVLGKGRNNK